MRIGTPFQSAEAHALADLRPDEGALAVKDVDSYSVWKRRKGS